MTHSTPLPDPGWYSAPHAGGEPRYWDGTQWYELSTPDPALAPLPAPEPEPEPEPEPQSVAAPVVGPAPVPPPYTGPSAAPWSPAAHPSIPYLPTPVPSAPTAGPAPRRRRAWPFVVGGGALVLLLGLASCTALLVNLGDRTTGDAIASAAPAPAPDAVPTSDAAAEEPEVDDSAYATFDAQTFTGTGDSVQAVDVSETAVITFECATCSSNTVLKTNGRDSLLVNTIGPHRGQYVVNTTEGAVITQMTVNADAAWTITVADLTTVPVVTGPASGSGDSVVVMSDDFSVAALTHDGDSNFVIQAYGTSSFSPLIANEIGAYRGTVEMSGPAVVQVTANGAWSITPQ